MKTQTTQNPIPEPVQPVSQTPAKPKNSLARPPARQVVILSVLLLISVAIAGFFALQTQKLTKQLAQYQTLPSPAPTTTPDPTANWKTYTFPDYPLEFKYPSNLTPVEQQYKHQGGKGLELQSTVASLRIMTRFPGNIDYSDREHLDVTTKPLLINGEQLVIADQEIQKNIIWDRISKSYFAEVLVNHPTKKDFAVFVTYEYKAAAIPQNDDQLFDQILSTFRFTN